MDVPTNFANRGLGTTRSMIIRGTPACSKLYGVRLRVDKIGTVVNNSNNREKERMTRQLEIKVGIAQS